MKKSIIIVLGFIMFAMTSASAQGPQRMTPEERAKASMEKMEVLNMDAATKEKANTIMTGFYTDQQKAMEDMRSSGTMDRDAMMAKRKELTDARDVKLKAILTADQYKKWTDEIVPSMMPQRKQ